jgi:signal transduction histidine kinase
LDRPLSAGPRWRWASRSLRGRLTITYTAALAVGLLAFGAFSLAAIDRNLKSSLDARLATTLHAFALTAAGHIGGSTLDAGVTRRLVSELGIQQNGAILERNGAVAMQSGALPSSVLRFAWKTAGKETSYATVGGVDGFRVADQLVPGSGNAATLVVWKPIDVIDDYERIAVTVFGAASLAIVAIAFVAGSFIVKRGLMPLEAMAAVASEIEAHDLTRRLSNSRWDQELQTFAATFDRMLERLGSAFASQRQFTADASHDLRAPLAVMRAEVDLALARSRDPQCDEASLLSIRDEVLELDRLLEALLLAARADSAPLRSAEIDVVELAARASDRLEPFAVSRSVRIMNSVAAIPPIVGDVDVLERVLISLLHNGIKFSPQNGTVSLCARESSGTVSLLVRDEGSGFSDEALKFACDRFWKDDTARGRSGTGLGLAVAKSAVERVGGSIAIRNRLAGGAEVETVFPVAMR